jgi:hypothetical protein
MASRTTSDRTTFIYGLVDPRTQELRYVGKTVLNPVRRVMVHSWRARTAPHKRHSMAWLLSLEKAGFAPDVFIIEEVPPDDDWIEAEQFWIAYFRMIGADLCNHTSGGEGQTGYKQPREVIEKRAMRMRGATNPNFGKPMHPRAKAALSEALVRCRADPGWSKWANERRQAAFSEDQKQRRIERLQQFMAVPENRAALDAKRAVITRLPQHRERVGEQSKELWRTRRSEIIAAQNAGKGAAWRAKQSALNAEKMKSLDHALRRDAFNRRKLSDAAIESIRDRLRRGERNCILAREYGVDPSTIGHIKSGRDR